MTTIKIDKPRPKYHLPCRVDLEGSGGNAFAVMGNVQKILKQYSRKVNDEVLAREARDDAEEYMKLATEGDYDDLLRVSAEYLEMEDVSGEYEFKYERK